MQKNGYSDLTEGPEAGWLGYYSLDKQGRMAGASLGDLITAAGAEGLVWTDPQVHTAKHATTTTILLTVQADPTVCGHNGHHRTSCGNTFSQCLSSNRAGKACEGSGMGSVFVP